MSGFPHLPVPSPSPGAPLLRCYGRNEYKFVIALPGADLRPYVSREDVSEEDILGDVMSKKILVGVFVGLLGLIAFNWLTSGEVALIPTTPLSAEGRQLARLEGEFAAVTHDYYQASRAAGLTGTDTTAEARAALERLDEMEKELLAMKRNNPAPAESRRIDQVLENIRKVRKS